MSPAERDEKILSLQPFVAEIARGYSRIINHRSAAYDELLSAGWVGAIKAVDSFNAKRGVAIEKYAKWRIRGEIRDYLRSLDYLSRDERRRVKASEAVAPLNVSIEQVRCPAEGSLTIGETISDPTGLRAFEVIDNVRSLDQLRAKVQLSPRVRTVYRKLLAGQDRAQIWREMRVTEGRVSQMYKKIVEQLRAAA